MIINHDQLLARRLQLSLNIWVLYDTKGLLITFYHILKKMNIRQFHTKMLISYSLCYNDSFFSD